MPACLPALQAQAIALMSEHSASEDSSEEESEEEFDSETSDDSEGGDASEGAQPPAKRRSSSRPRRAAGIAGQVGTETSGG